MSESARFTFDVEENAFGKLGNRVRESAPRIAAVAEGKTDKESHYNRVIASFTRAMQKGPNEKVVLGETEKLYIVNALALNRSFFESTLENGAFDTLIRTIDETSPVSLFKRLFLIYFNFFSTLDKADKLSLMEGRLKQFLQTYRGKNRAMLKYIELEAYLFGPLPDLLNRYNSDIETLQHDLAISDDAEFAKMLIKPYIASALGTLEYDEDDQQLFSAVLRRKELHFDGGLTLKEYTARLMIGRAMQEQKPYHHWQQFLFKLAGDPRSMRAYSPTLRTWNNIGQNETAYFIKTLFKDDMKLFMDLLSDPASDPDYAYRKAFWMPFLEQVVFAKVFIAETVFPTLAPELKERFNLHNDSYGTLLGSHEQSAIYMDFGRLKIIEFTRIGHMRAFRECPINLLKKSYSMKELDDMRFLSSCLFPLKHGGSKSYDWQMSLLPYLNKTLGLTVTKEDIEIPEDKAKRLA